MGNDKTAAFSSPQEAVKTIARLLRKEAWAELARYYDLTGTGVEVKTLESGDFFIRKDRPESAHPAGFWRHKEPFSPDFTYTSHTEAKTPSEVIVTVGVAIDQGGGMVQRGMSFFRLRRAGEGFHLVPNRGNEAGDVGSFPGEIGTVR